MGRILILMCIAILAIFLLSLFPRNKKDSIENQTTEIILTTTSTTTTTMASEKSNEKIPLRFFMDLDSGKGLLYFDNYTINDARTALKIWEEKTKIIEFIEVNNEKVADITIKWTSNLTKVLGTKTVGEAWYREGEIGGTVSLLPSGMSCRNQNRAMHEIGHLFGLNHSTNYMSVMYQYESCLQNVTDEDVKEVLEIFGK